EAIDDAIETIRKRTDNLGVSEPEIQAAGPNQISVGLPDVDNADRAESQVGTTAQLQFYDWESNVLGDPNAPTPGLFDVVTRAGKQKPRAESDDVPPGGAAKDIEQRFGGDKEKIREFYDRQNDSGAEKLYLFDKNEQLVTGPDPSCKELLSGYKPSDVPLGEKDKPKAGSPCAKELEALGSQAVQPGGGKARRLGGPPPGSQVKRVPRGIVVIKAERPDMLPENAPEPENYYVLEDDSELSGTDVENPEQQSDPQTQQPVVAFEFTDRGQKAFARVTKRLAERGSETIRPPGAPADSAFQRFAITLDNQVVSLATIDFGENPEGIDGKTGAQIEGLGGFQGANDLADNLRIGALPIDLKLVSKTQVSATLGKQALDQGLKAGAAGLLLTALFLLLFYRVLGGIAVVTLGLYAIFLVALVKLIPITLTLPGIAGMVLTLAVAADANIVIFERVKEEARTGVSIPRAIANGYTKALRTIIDANVVTILVAFILFMIATGGVRGFAFTLGVGTIISLFTAVLATSAIMGSLGRTRMLGSRFALGASGEGQRRKFDFVGRSKFFFSASGLIILAGAIAISTLGINFGIDFESGTRVKAPLERAASVDEVRSALAPAGLEGAEVQTVEEPELGENVIQIQTPELDPDGVVRLQRTLDAKFGVAVADFSADSIGPTFGAQIARTALIAVIASLLVIALYITLRFQFKFAVPV
ncbi:MAG: protein translocase subunit SecD, partial [Thermoleophilaceae bacterium]|nr:protein translocase subunit SecD [Thermoleophilaceae bacterium]